VNFNSWQITVAPTITNLLVEHIKNVTNNMPSQLLDTTKSEFTIVEKFVFDMAMFHLKRLNIQYDSKKYFIEFWWKNENAHAKLQKSQNNEIHGFHSDKDEHLYKTNNQLIHPFLSTVTYLNNSIFPTIITSSPEKNFNDKKHIVLDKGITLSFPKTMKHICFSPENIHGVYNVFSNINKNMDSETETETQLKTRTTLMFNIWDNYAPNCKTPQINNFINNLHLQKNQNQNQNQNSNDCININFHPDVCICESIQETKNKLIIPLKENEMCELIKIVLKRDTTIINNYITMDTINTHDCIQFDLFRD
jgi:hypothetical protein